MSTNRHIRQSKIYSYFYGGNTVFPQFLIIVGVLCLLLSSVSGQAVASIQQDKIDKLNEELLAATEIYEALYLKYGEKFEVQWGEEAELSGRREDPAAIP